MTEKRLYPLPSGEIPYQGFQIVDLREYEEQASMAGIDPDDLCDLLIEEVLSAFRFDSAA